MPIALQSMSIVKRRFIENFWFDEVLRNAGDVGIRELLASELDRLAVRSTLRGRVPLIPALQKQAACH
jgi:hypothetical protein